MNIKKLVAITLTVAFSAAFLIFIVSVFIGRNDETSQQASQPTAAQPVNSVQPSSQDSASEATQVQQSESQTTADDCSVKGSSCTREEIAKRNSKDNCWVIYKGSYYDITSYVSRHEGGSAVFNDKTCGNDIEPYLAGQASSAGRTNQHGASAYRDLESFKIGTVRN